MINLDEMSLSDLKKLQKDVEKAIASFTERQKRAALAAAEAAVREMGFNLAELVGTAKPSRSKSTLAAKYRHPENPSMAWSGRGRKPRWVNEAEAAGKSLESFLIS
jgi:DNA-binding protein H-NS